MGQICPWTTRPQRATITGTMAWMSEHERRNELGLFLKARRAELTPESIGLPRRTDTRRRVHGLRREEVAAAAAISTDYYTRIEQGRRGAPVTTLDAIAGALRLDDAGRAYLYRLASAHERPQESRRRQIVAPHYLQLIDELTTIPALMLGQRMDILAWNPLAAALYTDVSAISAHPRNYVQLIFTDPTVRERIQPWDRIARECVAQLHMEVARDPHDTQLIALVGQLSVADQDFRRWWGDHRVAVRHSGTKTFRHPVVGDLTLSWDTLTVAGDPDQQLITLTAESGSPSEQALRELAAITGGLR